MKKFVKYIGTSQNGFITGEVYELGELLNDRNKITLTGINGLFDFDLFEEVEQPMNTKPTYIAFAKHRPKIGKDFFVVRIVKGIFEPVKISNIINSSFLEGNIYRIETENSVYITEVSIIHWDYQHIERL